MRLAVQYALFSVCNLVRSTWTRVVERIFLEKQFTRGRDHSAVC